MYLDGLAIEIEFEHSEVGELLDFLLADMQPEGSDRKRLIARFCFTKNQNEWALSRNDGEYVINQAASCPKGSDDVHYLQTGRLT